MIKLSYLDSMTPQDALDRVRKARTTQIVVRVGGSNVAFRDICRGLWTATSASALPTGDWTIAGGVDCSAQPLVLVVYFANSVIVIDVK